MNKKLAIIGAGGHAKVVLDAALLMKQWEEIVFLDDFHNGRSEFMGFRLAGACALLGQALQPDVYDVALGIGSNNARAKYFETADKAGFTMPCIVHPSAVVSRFATLGRASVVFANAVINAGAKIGNGVIINTSASVDHDCILDDFVHISPGAHLAGNTHVGACSWMGIGSVSRQGAKIGTASMVGAGAAVIQDIASGVVAVGIPAKDFTKE